MDDDNYALPFVIHTSSMWLSSEDFSIVLHLSLGVSADVTL